MLVIAAVARSTRLWVFALAWFFISILPAILFLSPDYLYGSPRLNYLPSAGLALFWALPILAIVQPNFTKTWARAIRGLLVALYFLTH